MLLFGIDRRDIWTLILEIEIELNKIRSRVAERDEKYCCFCANKQKKKTIKSVVGVELKTKKDSKYCCCWLKCKSYSLCQLGKEKRTWKGE